jgi:diguanylate cyclase (GGDEF)-like protein
MVNRNFELNDEPLWNVPHAVQDRMLFGLDRSEYRSFLLSGIYCGMNVFLLALFGFYALSVGETRHSLILFAVAGTILAGYAAIWLTGWYSLARHFTTGMMVILCLYLFYTGGLRNTGPLYYFVFPSVAVFLHGRLRGFGWVVMLLLLTLVIWNGAFDFDVTRYDNVFVSHTVVICILIALLACIPEYFRMQAERNLLLSISDLESLVYGDPSTQLANRPLLEKFLQLEFNRNLRYDSACCLMFIELDPVASAIPQVHTRVDDKRLQAALADILRRNLRVQDIAGRWDANCFMLVLPEISLEGAELLAGRLLEEVRAQGKMLGRVPGEITASIGIAAFDKSPLQDVLNRVANNLIEAQQKRDSYVTL